MARRQKALKNSWGQQACATIYKAKEKICIASFVGILQKKVIEAVMDLVPACQALSVVIQ